MDEQVVPQSKSLATLGAQMLSVLRPDMNLFVAVQPVLRDHPAPTNIAHVSLRPRLPAFMHVSLMGIERTSLHTDATDFANHKGRIMNSGDVTLPSRQHGEAFRTVGAYVGECPLGRVARCDVNIVRLGGGEVVEMWADFATNCRLATGWGRVRPGDVPAEGGDVEEEDATTGTS